MFVSSGGKIVRAGKDEVEISTRAEAAAGGPRLSLSPRGYVLGHLTQKSDGRTLILHLLNHDLQASTEDVKFRLDLSGLVRDLNHWEVKVLSPNAAHPQLEDLTPRRSVIDFTLRRIDHYAVVTLSAKPEP